MGLTLLAHPVQQSLHIKLLVFTVATSRLNLRHNKRQKVLSTQFQNNFDDTCILLQRCFVGEIDRFASCVYVYNNLQVSVFFWQCLRCKCYSQLKCYNCKAKISPSHCRDTSISIAFTFTMLFTIPHLRAKYFFWFNILNSFLNTV